MFVYFIQRKGFLDGDPNYLRTHLERTQRELGDDHYYRDFLCPLFFEGFAKKDHSPQIKQLLGTVPYLSGSIFERHQLEERYGQAIDIPDAAFARIFAFFDGYSWHLDERPLRADDEINPDVLGFIFEKYINQKQMGAYYTKEDITGYISRNTILPALFERARKECRIAFEGENSVWNQLAADPERYIYPAMRKGLDLTLPEPVAAGLKDVARRGEWNKPAAEEYALPTEIWRETVARRERAAEVRALLAAGQVREINDLITYNLDIQQFAQDVIEDSEGPELVRAYWKGLTELKVLDPTCGSGAFLFAALNILEPLYEACLDRMQSFIDDLDAAAARGTKIHPEKYADFRRILAQVAKHPNRAYFIYKSIIVQNLYGVDIMEEATEICKLRLFLKLIAQVESVKEIEPLPDIDFNVRAGNTLVGFTNREEVRKALTSQGSQGTLGLFGENEAADQVEEQAELADKAFIRFRQMQTDENMDVAAFSAAKAELRKRLAELNEQLNRALALRYLPAPIKEDAYLNWCRSHHPFNWFVEFYGIKKNGGFDVIIGNPPYIDYRKVKESYQVKNYFSLDTNNLYAYCMERSLYLAKQSSRFGMIVPVSSISGESYKKLFNLFLPYTNWISSYSNRPGKLFKDVEQRLTIFITSFSKENKLYSSRYQHWVEGCRQFLFPLLSYEKSQTWNITGLPVKLGDLKAISAYQKIITRGNGYTLANIEVRGSAGVWYHNGPTYWVRSLAFEPKGNTGSDKSNHYINIKVKDQKMANVLAAIMNSSTYYLFFKAISNCRDLGHKEWAEYPLGHLSDGTLAKLATLGEQLAESLRRTSSQKSRQYPSGYIQYDEYYPAKSKTIIDQIDQVLAEHYGFADEELDFIVNYDIKYRMGQELDDDGEE